MVVALLAGSVVITAVLAVVSRRFRRYLFRHLSILLLLFALVFLIASTVPRPDNPETMPDILMGAVQGSSERPSDTVDVPDASPSMAWVLLIAVAVALGAVTTVWIGWRTVRALLFRREDADDCAGLQAIARSAGNAAEALQSGRDARDVVMRCYREMVDTMARLQGLTRVSYLTPHEFAERLRKQGMSDAHVDRLTDIFVVVRYGHREPDSYTKEAITCMNAVRRAYGVPRS